ncbi:MAG: flippase [Candidatus Moranbacteria bacterium]|nr:flippase [Candidatus Moranbacteria bacterium]
MALAGRIAYNVVFNAVAKVISTALALVAIGFITRYLGKDGFGNYATMLAFFAFFNAIGDLGLQSVTAREISREGAKESHIMSNVLTLRLAISLLILVLTPALAFFLPYSVDLKFAIIVAALAFVFSSVSMTLNGIFQKHLAMDKVATIELGGKLVQLSIIIIAVQKDLGFMTIALALLSYMMFNALAVFFISRNYFSFSFQCDWAYWKGFLKQSIPLGIASVIGFAYFKADTIMLSFLKSSADVGIYNVAYKVIENLIFFPAMVAGLVLPLLSRFIFTERAKFDLIANKTFKVFLVLVVPLVIGVFSLAPQIVGIIGGAGFPESAAILRTLIFSLAFIFFGQFFNTIVVVSNLQGKLMNAFILAAIINISLNLLLIPRYSYTGAAFTSVLTEMVVVACSFLIVYRHTHYRPTITNLWSIALSGALMGLYLWFFSSLHLALLILGSIAIYLSSLWMTDAIEKEEILQVLAGSKFARNNGAIVE